MGTAKKSNITKRTEKGSALTHEELDQNFTEIEYTIDDIANVDIAVNNRVDAFSQEYDENIDSKLQPYVDNAGQEADRAETARDAAQLSAGVYADTSTGLAVTTEGDYFSVPALSSDEYLILYRHDAGPTATEIKRYPSTEALQHFGKNSGTKAVWAIEDSNGNVAAYIDAEGELYAGGRKRPVSDPGIDSSEVQGLPLLSFADIDGDNAMVIERDGRIWTSAHGYIAEGAASSDLGRAQDYEAFGEADKATFLRDKAKTSLGNRVLIERIGARWNADPDVNFARMATVMPIDNDSGILFFVQRRDYSGAGQAGERCTRLVSRNYEIDYEDGDISFSSTKVIDQPPRWVDALDKTFPCCPIRVEGGANDGRIIIIYMILDSDTGLQEAPCEFDLVMRYSDDNGSTWSAVQTIFDGAYPYDGTVVTQAKPDYAGYVPGPGNFVTQIPADDPNHPGRIVVAAPIHPGTSDWHQGVIYSDDYGQTWQHGAYQRAGRNYTEPSIVYAADRSLLMLCRSDLGRGGPPYEDTPGRGMFRSTDGGATFSYLGYNETAAFNNCASALIRSSFAAKDGYPKIITTGPKTISNTRENFKILLSYDSQGGNFVGSSSVFPPEQIVSYSHMTRLKNGMYALAYETPNGLSFNTQSNVGLVIFNEAAIMHNAKLIEE